MRQRLLDDSVTFCLNQDVQDGWIIRIPARLAAYIILPTNPTLQIPEFPYS